MTTMTTPNDWRALCAELADALEEWARGQGSSVDAPLIARTRAALTEAYEAEANNPPEGHPDPEPFQAILRERAAVIDQPEPQGPTDEALAGFTAWFCRNYPGPDTIIHKPEWHAPKVFRAAVSALTRWGRPAIEPVPVAERPWERKGWCDAEGRCWWNRPSEELCNSDWFLATRSEVEEFCDSWPPTVSLPHWALPVPMPDERNHHRNTMTTPTSTDWRALCAELLDVIGSLVGGVNCGHYRQRDMWKCREIFKRARAALAQPEPDPSSLSDGYHTFAELYEHRHALCLALMRAMPQHWWFSWRHANGEPCFSDDGWFIVGAELPGGSTVSYHLPADLYPIAQATGAAELETGRPWDGHTAFDVAVRLRSWAALAQPEPPADGEVAELVAALEADAECVEVEHYDLCNMTAEQMRRAATLLQQLSAITTEDLKND